MRTFKILTIISILSINLSFSQQSSNIIRIKLDTINNIAQSRLPMRIVNSIQIWPAIGKAVDSVLWEIPIQYGYFLKEQYQKKKISDSIFRKLMDHEKVDTTRLKCKNLPKALYVISSREQNLIKVQVLTRYNKFMDRDITLSYNIDSLRKWTIKQLPKDAIPKLTINYPYCFSNQVVNVPIELYLIPSGTLYNARIQQSDNRLNELPLYLKGGKERIAKLGNAVIYFYKQNYELPESKVVTITVSEEGSFQTDRLLSKLHYKEEYRISDTLVIDSRQYKIDSLDKNWQYVYLKELNRKDQIIQIPGNYLRDLSPYFSKSKDIMVLDFWGTWCKPCIEVMPELKELYEKVGNKVNFLSVCVDNRDKITLSKAIFAEKGIKWPQIFNDMTSKNTLTASLGIQCFPTYVIVNKKGEVIFSSCGENGFNDLKKQILEIN